MPEAFRSPHRAHASPLACLLLVCLVPPAAIACRAWRLPPPCSVGGARTYIIGTYGSMYIHTYMGRGADVRYVLNTV